MSNTKEIYVTNAGMEQMKEELENLIQEKRPEVIKALKEARALGDLSENAEYDAARNEQAQVEGRIQVLTTKHLLRKPNWNQDFSPKEKLCTV